jgi:hypothetical protein
VALLKNKTKDVKEIKEVKDKDRTVHARGLRGILVK